MRLVLLVLTVAGCATTETQYAQGKQSLAQGDYHTAFMELEPVAEKGNASAQYTVAYMYYYGEGVPRDPQQARRWMQLAADQGLTEAEEGLKTITAQVQPTTAYTTSLIS